MKLKMFSKLAVMASIISLSAIASSLDDKISMVSTKDIQGKASTLSFGSGRSRANGNGIGKRAKCSEWVATAADKAGSTVCASH